MTDFEAGERAAGSGIAWGRILGLPEGGLDAGAAARTAAILGAGLCALGAVGWASLRVAHAWSWIALAGVAVSAACMCVRATGRPLRVEEARGFLVGWGLALLFATASWHLFDMVWEVESATRAGALSAKPNLLFVNTLGGLLFGALASACAASFCGWVSGVVARIHRAVR